MDTTGYGRSTRPAPMNDPCNLTREQQRAFVPGLIAAPCEPTYAQQMTTLASDWNDIGAVVDYLRALRHVDRVTLFGWSLGGKRLREYLPGLVPLMVGPGYPSVTCLSWVMAVMALGQPA